MALGDKNRTTVSKTDKSKDKKDKVTATTTTSKPKKARESKEMLIISDNESDKAVALVMYMKSDILKGLDMSKEKDKKLESQTRNNSEQIIKKLRTPKDFDYVKFLKAVGGKKGAIQIVQGDASKTDLIEAMNDLKAAFVGQWGGANRGTGTPKPPKPNRTDIAKQIKF